MQNEIKCEYPVKFISLDALCTLCWLLGYYQNVEDGFMPEDDMHSISKKELQRKKISKAFAIVSQNKHQTGVEYWESRLIGFALEAANT